MESLSGDQSSLLKHFQEVTDIHDEQIALATLASVDWDLTKAIDASIARSLSPDVIADAVPHPPKSPSVSSENSLSDSHDNDLSGTSHSRTRAQEHRGPKRPLRRKSRLSTRNDANIDVPMTSRRARNGGEIVANLSARYILTRHRTRNIQPSSNSRAVSEVAPEVITIDSDDNDEDDYNGASNNKYSPMDVDDTESTNLVQQEQRSLIPSNVVGFVDGTMRFLAAFEDRYGAGHPEFFMGNFDDAMHEAFNNGRGIMERRPLVLYIHNDRSIAANIFAQQVLCDSQVSALINGQFIVWPWDVTHDENRRVLIDYLRTTRLNEIKGTVLSHISFPTSRFPLVLIFGKNKGTIQSLGMAWGSHSANELLNILLESLQVFQNIKQTELNEEQERLERENIRAQQAREYELSLAQDRARQEQIELKQRENRAKEEERLRIEEAKALRASELAASLPPEPDACDKDISHVRFRFPNGHIEVRRFRNSEPVRHIVTFIEAKEHCPSNYRIWTSDLPRKNFIACYNLDDAFSDLDWPVREQLTVEEI